MKIKNYVHAGVNGKFIPDEQWNRIVELIERNNQLIRELKGEVQ